MRNLRSKTSNNISSLMRGLLTGKLQELLLGSENTAPALFLVAVLSGKRCERHEQEAIFECQACDETMLTTQAVSSAPLL